MSVEFASCSHRQSAARIYSSNSHYFCSPCIIFFDEIESVFKNREMEDVSSSSQQVVTQLLLKMDDVRKRNQKGGNKFVFIIGATNLPEVFCSERR